MFGHNKNKNPDISDVKISKEKLAELNSELEKRTSWNKNANIRKYLGGTCTICQETPTKKVSYNLEGYGQRVEWYCAKCFERWIASK